MLDLDAKPVSGDESLESYFLRFMRSLLELFSSDRGMQEERLAFIIRSLLILHRSFLLLLLLLPTKIPHWTSCDIVSNLDSLGMLQAAVSFAER